MEVSGQASCQAAVPSKSTRRWPRLLGAALVGFLLLAAILPSTGCLDRGLVPNPRMWRCGPFLFHPGPFFSAAATIVALLGCTVFGIVRHNVCEAIGWILMGLVLVLFILCG